MCTRQGIMAASWLVGGMLVIVIFILSPGMEGVGGGPDKLQ